MKKSKKLMQALILSAVLLCGICIGASASGGLQAITAYLSPDITITLDGSPKQILDASGHRTYPISYNGTTYVPIRSLSNLLGLEVGWDQATKTVLLSKTAGSVNRMDLISEFKPYTEYNPGSLMNDSWYNRVAFVQKSEKKTAEIGGVTLDHWIKLWSGAYAEDHSSEKERRVFTSFNLLGKYTTLTFQAYSEGDTTLTIQGDNEGTLAQFRLTGGQVPQTFTVDLKNTNQLTFVCEDFVDKVNQSGTCTYIFNAYLS